MPERFGIGSCMTPAPSTGRAVWCGCAAQVMGGIEEVVIGAGVYNLDNFFAFDVVHWAL